jgi:hypothetical protein
MFLAQRNLAVGTNRFDDAHENPACCAMMDY